MLSNNVASYIIYNKHDKGAIQMIGDMQNWTPNVAGIIEHAKEIHPKPEIISRLVSGEVHRSNYEEVCKGDTNHAEVVQINFDENKISFKKILDYFWDCHDPTQLNQQGPDLGTQYRSIIFYYDNIQLEEAKKSRDLKQLLIKKDIVTEIIPFKEFFIAEDYHQLFICKRA